MGQSRVGKGCRTPAGTEREALPRASQPRKSRESVLRLVSNAGPKLHLDGSGVRSEEQNILSSESVLQDIDSLNEGDREFPRVSSVPLLSVQGENTPFVVKMGVGNPLWRGAVASRYPGGVEWEKERALSASHFGSGRTIPGYRFRRIGIPPRCLHPRCRRAVRRDTLPNTRSGLRRRRMHPCLPGPCNSQEPDLRGPRRS